MSKISKLLLLLAVFSFIIMLAIKFIAGGWVPFLWIPLGLIVGCIAAALFLDRAMYIDFFTMKTTKQGMNMGTVILLVIVLLVAVNVFSVRKSKTFDFSLAQINTLSDQSIQLVKTLSEDLKVMYFYKKNEENVDQNKRQFIELIKKYQDQSSFVKLEFVEMNERPDLVEKYEVSKGTGVVFLEYKSKKNKIEKIDEQEITGALVRVTREKNKTIYFVVGHAEKDISDASSPKGAGGLKGLLEGNNYTVKPLNLVQTDKVPEDADMVYLLGPQQDFLPNEIKALEAYAENGGSLVVLVYSGKTSSLSGFLNKLGVQINNDFVVQVLQTQMGMAVNPAATPVAEFSTVHGITKPFGKNQFGIMVLPTSLQRTQPLPEGFNFQEIAKAPMQTMAFTSKTFDKEAGKGPHALIAAVTGKLSKEGKEFNLVVYGDAEVFSNQYLYKNLNRDLALNTAAFLSKDENLISISPKEVGVTEMTLTPNQFGIYLMGFIIPLPILLLITSGTLWYRRRHA